MNDLLVYTIIINDEAGAPHLMGMYWTPEGDIYLRDLGVTV